MPEARILVVEDNTDNYELVRFLLERAGYKVLRAANGKQAIQLAHQELPDLILLDLALPVLDGWSAAAQLKADEATRSIPLIALTAYTLPGDRQRALAAGCDGYIGKPMNVKAFVGEIEGYLSKRNDEA
jgi:two-component system cell cycle response regulator DivK